MSGYWRDPATGVKDAAGVPAPRSESRTEAQLDEYDDLLAERALLRHILRYGVIAEDEADGLVILSTASVYPLSGPQAKTARRVVADLAAAAPRDRRRRPR